MKAPEDKSHWLVDEKAAKVVRDIFRLCVQGCGVSQIAKEITGRRILNPTAHAKANGRGIPDNRDGDNDYTWRDSTISRMLSRPEYLGHTVNFKTYRKSYKQKKQLKRDPSEWQIFENTHEAINDRETYDIVQRIRDGRRRVTPMGEMPALSGMVFCADCGAKMSESYEAEQKTLVSRVTKLQNLIAAQQESTVNTDRFLALVRKYTDIRELTPEIIWKFVERIEFCKAERIGGKKVQRMRIIWNCIGEFLPPQKDEKTA